MRVPTGLLIALCLPAAPVFAESISLRPVANTFVVDAGPALIGTDYEDANSINFGGSGSQSVASPAAFAYSPDEGISDEPKGEFTGLIKFDTAALEDVRILSARLTLNIINGNEKAFGLFNIRGSAGDFDVSMATNNWLQGYSSPDVPEMDYGVTYNSLAHLNGLYQPVPIAAFYYDAAYPHSVGAVWYSYEFDLAGSAAPLEDALEDGDTITLMLSAAAGSGVSFNYMGYIQNILDSAPTIRSTGPKLEVEYCTVSAGDINRDCTVNILDFALLADNWLVSTN